VAPVLAAGPCKLVPVMIPANTFKIKREVRPMRRKVFDVLVSAGGLLVVAVLVVAGRC